MENRYVLNLDFKQRSIFNVNFIQGDINSSVLEFRILNGGVPVDISDQEVTVSFYKPDGTIVIQDNLTGVTVIDAVTGKVQCVLGPNTLAVVGIVKGEVDFSADGFKLTSAQFTFNVTSSIDNGNDIMSISEIPKLDAKLIEIQSLYNDDKATWDAEVQAKLDQADAKMAEEDAKILDIQAQYNDDSTQWNSAVNNKIAEAIVKIGETETARQATITATTNAQTATTATNAAITNANNTVEDMVNTSKMILKPPVSIYADLATTYPAPELYWTVRIMNTGELRRYNGSTWEWIDTLNVEVYDTVIQTLNSNTNTIVDAQMVLSMGGMI